jgi:hypothetical protein
MAAHYLGGDSAASGSPRALLVHAEAISPETAKLSRLLKCLGIDVEVFSAEEISRRQSEKTRRSGEPYCILTSASCLATLPGSPEVGGNDLPNWLSKAESVYVYDFAENDGSRRVLRLLTGDSNANIRRTTAQQSFMSVSGGFPEMCGPMSGMEFRVKPPEGQILFEIFAPSDSFRSVIGTNHGELMVAAKYAGVPFFLNSSAHTIDVNAPCRKYIDVRETFTALVPAIMYTRFAFGIGAREEISACLIVDDPPLKPRYGFMKFSQILGLMDQHNFAMTIAFIPWNWSRTDARTVRLFRNRPDKLSLCVHGCDHTAREFAERSSAVLQKRVNVANQRMQLLGRRTHLSHANIMLFPQGVFSVGAARALKLNGFVAAANTEVMPIHEEENKTTVGDLLQVAIMKYGSFSIFTRRYLAHGAENFAFDGLLGKPCLIAAHHDDFAGNARVLLEVIAKLNALNWNLRWRPLGEAIGRTFTSRRQASGGNCVEIYGAHLVYRNAHHSSEPTLFVKRESDPDRVKAVTVNAVQVDHSCHGEYLHFEANLPPNSNAEVRILYSDEPPLSFSEDSLNYRAKALLRRYLSEFRDNYLSRNMLLYQHAVRIKEAFRL